MSENPDPKKTRRMLLLLGAISLAPFVCSSLLYYFWKPGAFTNYGELIEVMPLAGEAVMARDGKAFRFDDLRGRWVFMMIDSGNCDDYCRSKLYVMRQIRLTQGKDRERIERLWLIPDGVRPPMGIEAQYQGTLQVMAAEGGFVGRLPAPVSPRDHIYVVDPFGNLMMRFPRDADPQRMKKDIFRLMKISGGWVRTGK